MTTHKETYEFCEQLIKSNIDEMYDDISSTKDENKKENLKNSIQTAYEHLKNIQNMKKTYLNGR